jgi:Bacterial Ig-like domain (group 3)/FG-GAP-like repeat
MLLCIFGMAGPLRALTSTATTLTVANTSGSTVASVDTGTIVVLTAKVTKTGGGEVTLGTVNFCDASAAYCEDEHLLGSAQVTSKGTAILKFKPSVGNHSYQAVFHGTTSYSFSASGVENLAVTGGPYATTTSIAQSGSAGNYTLMATVSASGSPALSPTGTIDYLDTTNSNYVLGSSTLAAGPTTPSYAPYVGSYAGQNPSQVLVADFNQDGIPDLITMTTSNGSGADMISVLLGKGDGTYQAATTYTYNTPPYGISLVAMAVGDLNGDGYPDVVVVTQSNPSLMVFMNDGKGDGVLNQGNTYIFNYSDNLSDNGAMGYPGGVAIGDLNNDGKMDVMLTFPDYNPPSGGSCSGQTCTAVGVMLGNGDGTLQFGNNSGPPPWVPVFNSGLVPAGPYATGQIVLADLHRNGNLDAVVTNLENSQACVVPGNGDGTFGSPSCYTVDYQANAAVEGDFNGDGIPDLATASGGNSVSVLLGNGDGTFQNAVNYESDSNAATEPNPDSIVAADVNGDGKLDLVTGNVDGSVSVLLGNGDGTFGTAAYYPASASNTNDFNGVAVADLNGDGVLDLVGLDPTNGTADVLLGSLSTSATAKLTGVSPVGANTTSHTVEASYPGDNEYLGSTSATTSLSALPVPTTLGLASNLSAVTVGGQVTLTATIFPDSLQDHSPSNPVTFYMNGNSIGTATPSNGVAALTYRLSVVQTDSFTATYGGDSNFVGSSTTSAVSVTVQKAATTLTLQVCNYSGGNWICPATTSNYGGEMTVTATLSPSSVTGGGSSDGETVTLYNNGTSYGTATLSGGSVTFNLDQIPAGNYSFTASYGGDPIFLASTTSTPSLMTVTKAASSMSVTINPVTSSPYGQQVELTVEFLTYPYNVSGETVTFYNGANVVGTAQLSSGTPTAFLRLNNLPVGNYNFKVSYPGDSNFNASSSTAPTVSVQPLATTLTVSAPSTITFTYGTQIIVQVFLEPYNVQGGNTTNGELVTLYQNGAIIGAAAVSGGIATFTVNAPPVGIDAYTASYAGDTSFAASTAPAAYVSVQQATTTMGITTNALHGIAATGQPVTLTATVSSNLATGTVFFCENANPCQNGNNIGSGTLANGVATLIVNGLPEGGYTFGASYSGDANFTGSTASPTASLTVLQATTLTLATSPAHYAAPNQPVTITVTLSPSSIPGDNTNGQTVYIYNGTSQFGNATLSNGVGTFTPTNGLPQGSYSFTAVYDSDGILSSSTTATPVAFAVVTGQLFVVNTSADDAGTAGNCTPQSSTTSNSTDSACSLRDALLAAANAPEGASISFATSAFPAATTITLTNGGLTLPANTTLTGPTLNSGGANVTNLVTVDGNGNYNQASSTVFTVTGTGTAISNLTISGGWTPWNGGVPGNGGGILNSGNLTLTNSTVTNNGTIFSGGGIYNTGTLTVVGSTFSNNTAAANGIGDGGGIDNGGGTLTVINSTFANNTVRGGWGGGIAVDAGSATITNSTITGNSVGGGGGGISTVVPNSEGVTSPGGTVTLANTIVSGNNDFFSDIDDGGISYTDQGGNIVGYINRTFTPVNDPNILNLGPLDNYGGPTQTILPLPGSQVICAGNYAVSPSQWAPPLVAINIDQRGYPNYNLNYGQLRWANGGNPLPSACFDSGAVQTNYQSVQFQQSSYAGVAGGEIIPAVVASVTENGVNRQAVPVTLNYSGPGNLSSNAVFTVAGSGATFSNLSVDTVGSGSLGTTLIIAGTSYINASTSLRILPALTILPGSENIFAAAGVPLSQTFSVSNGSGNYQLSSSGTLPPGLTLTPSGTATGTGWTLSGTSSQYGSYNFTLTATDVTNSVITLSQSYTLTIAPATFTTLAASPAVTAPLGQTLTLTATVSSPTATGTVSFFDGSSLLASGVSLSGGSPNIATFALSISTLGTHSFTAQFSGDATDAASTSNTVPYNVTLPNFVVNTTSDDNGSYPCATLASTTSNTTDGNTSGNPGLCTLRDALNTASGLGAGSVYFDTTVFAASNLTNPAANTIYPNIASNGSLSIPSNTTIYGLTSSDGVTLTNLVTVDGGGSGVTGNGSIFVVNGASAAINNLNINNGYASNGGSGGAIAGGTINNTASFSVSGSSFTGNQATGSGGAIFNGFGGTLTVANSTFASNSATGGNGGAIDNANYYGCGTTMVTNSTFYQNTATNGGNGYGGAINNDGNGPCMVTVNSSTVVGNSTDNSNPSDGFGGGGGGIYSQYELFLANNVITGNTVSGSSEDDLDDNFWISNYTAGNTYAGINIINGNFIGIWNGYTKNGVNVTLAPLASYGGPTQTMIPLPGSVAICAGIANGTTTDQRGEPTQPTGGYCPSGTVDAGSVQTNYAISFITQPPTNVTAGQVIAPAPGVSLTESGSAFTTANADTVNMTDSASLLSGTTSEAFSLGAASFNNLIITGSTNNDILIATLPLNGAINIITLATTGISATAIPATLTPSSGTLSASQTFTWNNGAGPSKFSLQIGTTGFGSTDLLKTGETTATTATVSIPSNGEKVYATFYQIINGAWQTSEYTFTEPGSPTPATLTPSSGILSTSQKFTWTNGLGPTKFSLQIGTTGFGSTDLLKTGVTPETTATVSIPSNGAKVYAVFYQLINGAWQTLEYTFTEPGSTPAKLTPSTGTLSPSQTFNWGNGVGQTQYSLQIGTSGFGSTDLLKTGVTHATTAIVNIPSNGAKVYAVFYQLINGAWQTSEYTFNEPGSTPAKLTPSTGTLSASQTFNWNNGVGPTEYSLQLGTTGFGSTDLLKTGVTTATTSTVTIPSDGATVYATFYQLINGTWQTSEYTFTEP